MREVSWQTIVMIAIAVFCVLMSVIPTFHDVASWLQNLASLLVGGALIPRKEDVSIKTVEKVVSSVAKSFKPPPASIPPTEDPS